MRSTLCAMVRSRAQCAFVRVCVCVCVCVFWGGVCVCEREMCDMLTYLAATGLAGSVWTSNLSRGHRVAQAIHSGMRHAYLVDSCFWKLKSLICQRFDACCRDGLGKLLATPVQYPIRMQLYSCHNHIVIVLVYHVC